eukprot:gb/GECG01001964.1/.p1 GENE.gb/GECG01001964.1/~~gb/GECG01001964.1/.p1  ORF type:complete len:905 (+),score=69.08 gb/GECG01001964.1/:1-2715(+)
MLPLTEMQHAYQKSKRRRASRIRACLVAAFILLSTIYVSLKPAFAPRLRGASRHLGVHTRSLWSPDSHYINTTTTPAITSSSAVETRGGIFRDAYNDLTKLLDWTRHPHSTTEETDTFYSERGLLDDNINKTTCGAHIKDKFKCDEDECKDRVSGFINYLMIYECWWDEVQPLVWICYILWLIFLLYMLGNTADAFFCPALEVIVDILKVSPDIAGVTFLSFGNGAPDVFSSLAAYISGVGQVGVSAILGAGVFVVTVVVGAVCLTSEVQLSKGFFLRDVSFYCVAVVYLLINFWIDSLNIGQALGFIALYVVYALIAIFGDRLFSGKKSSSKLEGVDDSALLTEDEVCGDVAADETSINSLPRPKKETSSWRLAREGSQRLTREASQLYPRLSIPPNDDIAIHRRNKYEHLPNGDERHLNAQSTYPLKNPSLGETAARGRARSEHWEYSLSHTELDELTGQQDATPPKSKKMLALSPEAPLSNNFTDKKYRCMSVQPGPNYSGTMGATEKRKRLKYEVWLQSLKQHENKSLFRSNYRWIEHLLGSLRVNDREEREIIERAQRTSRWRSRAPTNTRKRRSSGGQYFNFDSEIDQEPGDTNGRYESYVTAEEEAENDIEMGPSFLEKYFGDESRFSRCMYYFLLPGLFVRQITVPILQKDEYDWRYVAVTPLLGLPWIFLTALGIVGEDTSAFINGVADSTPWLSWALLSFAIGLLSSAMLVVYLRKLEYPRGIPLVMLTLFSFLSSVCWVINVANEIVGLLGATGLLLGISPSLLAMSVLAWGNSLGDLVADVTVAKEGIPSMAIAATYAGPCFNLLIGLGLSTSVAIWKQGDLKLQPPSSDGKSALHSTDVIYCNFAFLLASLILVLIVVPLSGYKMSRRLGVILILLYVVYFIVSMILQYVG